MIEEEIILLKIGEIVQLKEYGSDGTPPVALANIVAEVSSIFYNRKDIQKKYTFTDFRSMVSHCNS